MRVLVAHNRYRSGSPSGENLAVDLEVALLREAGVEVAEVRRSSDDVATASPAALLAAGLGPVYDRQGVRDFAEALDAFRPDVVHCHNLYPLLSPQVIRLARRRGLPVVHTVHNYRRRCMNGYYFRAGGPCTACTGPWGPLPGVAHGCYRGSRVQSAAIAASLLAHRATWDGVSLHLAVSRCVAASLLDTGVPAARVAVKPNPVVDPGPPLPAGDTVVHAGRLEPAKGTALLLDAWRASGARSRLVLEVYGDGPDRDLVVAAAAADPSIRYRGLRPRPEVVEAMRRSRLVVVPSAWPEAFGLVAVEALACARPVVACRVGALPEIVTDEVGWLADPRPDALASVLEAAAGAPDLEARGAAARARYLTRYTPAACTAELLERYRALVPTGSPS